MSKYNEYTVDRLLGCIAQELHIDPTLISSEIGKKSITGDSSIFEIDLLHSLQFVKSLPMKVYIQAESKESDNIDKLRISDHLKDLEYMHNFDDIKAEMKSVLELYIDEMKTADNNEVKRGEGWLGIRKPFYNSDRIEYNREVRAVKSKYEPKWNAMQKKLVRIISDSKLDIKLDGGGEILAVINYKPQEIGFMSWRAEEFYPGSFGAKLYVTLTPEDGTLDGTGILANPLIKGICKNYKNARISFDSVVIEGEGNRFDISARNDKIYDESVLDAFKILNLGKLRCK